MKKENATEDVDKLLTGEVRTISAEIDRLKKLDITKNIGDYRVFRNTTTWPDRNKMANKRAMFSTIFPGEVVLADNETKNFTYFWLFTKGNRYDEELDELYEKGYEPVKVVESGGKWKVSERFRRTPEGYATWAGHILYAQSAEKCLEMEREEKEETAYRNDPKKIAGSFAESGRGTGGILNRKGAGAFIKLPGGISEEV